MEQQRLVAKARAAAVQDAGKEAKLSKYHEEKAMEKLLEGQWMVCDDKVNFIGKCSHLAQYEGKAPVAWQMYENMKLGKQATPSTVAFRKRQKLAEEEVRNKAAMDQASLVAAQLGPRSALQGYPGWALQGPPPLPGPPATQA